MKDDWALCVGIGLYDPRGPLSPLPGAVNDAEAMHSWLIGPGGLPPENATLIVSPDAQKPEDAAPTAHGLGQFFLKLDFRAREAELRGEGYRVGRRLWVYGAGHGIGFQRPDHDDTGLLTADSIPPNWLPHLPGRAWLRPLQESKIFDEIIVILDCCRTRSNTVQPSRPVLEHSPVGEGAKVMVAFASVPGTAAYGEQVGGVDRGRFTYEVERLLKDPPELPLRAGRFLELLSTRHTPTRGGLGGHGPAYDFVLLEAPVAVSEGVLIAHGETTEALADRLASELRFRGRHAGFAPAENLMNEDPTAFEKVEELVITRDVDLGQLRDLVTRVAPRRAVLFAERDPGVDAVPNTRFFPRADGDDARVDDLLPQLDALLADAFGSLTVRAAESVAHVRVWSEEGRTVGDGWGEVMLEAVPTGEYHARASLGGAYEKACARVVADTDTELRLPELNLPQPSPAHLATIDEATVCREAGRVIAPIPLGDGDVLLSLPERDGWRTEVFTPPGDEVGISVRMVPNAHPVGAPSPTDRAREAAVRALATPSSPVVGEPVDHLGGDPIAALLTAALRARAGADPEAHLRAAASVLGDDDLDVRLLRGEVLLTEVPPLLAQPWQHALRASRLDVAANSTADRVAGRLWLVPPWFAWSRDEHVPGAFWLPQVADLVWPGWNLESPSAMALVNLDSAATVLGVPAASARRRSRNTYKSPPVDRIVDHDRIAFVGASNDQLPAAMVVAFALRGRKWDRVDVWTLNDAPLRETISANRTGENLLEARNVAEKRLEAILGATCVEAEMHRYDGMVIEGQRTFAALWDWDVCGRGYVHASPWRIAEDIRVAPQQNPIWVAGDRSARYAEVVEAYEAMAKRAAR